MTHEARVGQVLSWSHQAFDLLCDLEQVVAACAHAERYQRLITLVREHNVELTGRQYAVCSPRDTGRSALLVTPKRTRVLRTPDMMEASLLSLDEALAAEGLNRPTRVHLIAGDDNAAPDDAIRPMRDQRVG